MTNTTAHAAVIDLRAIQNFTFLTLLTAGIYFLLCSPAFALTGFTPVGIVLCNIVTMIWSDIGRGIATLAVMIIGIMATLGKATWGQAMLVAVGVSLVFGAPVVIPQLFLIGFGTFLSGFVFSCI